MHFVTVDLEPVTLTGDVTRVSCDDGLLLYSGYTGELNADFISLSLTQSYVEFRFSLGTGSAIIRSVYHLQLIQV